MFHNVKTFHDARGSVVAMVPLNGGARGYALIDWSDLQAIVAAGLTTVWNLNHNGRNHSYVRCYQRNASGQRVGVARAIVGASARQIISYRDGDRTNLRRSNLVIGKGRAKRNDLRIVKNLRAFTQSTGL
jgi:hypothetical protein